MRSYTIVYPIKSFCLNNIGAIRKDSFSRVYAWFDAGLGLWRKDLFELERKTMATWSMVLDELVYCHSF